MRVLFVRPKPSADTIGLQHIMIVEPLELEILASTIQREHNVLIVDMILEHKSLTFFIKSYLPEVVCITGYITHIPIIRKYCRIIKSINEDIITITGGVHVEKFPEDIEDKNIDYRVVRNAIVQFPLLIKYLHDKKGFPDGVLKKKQEIRDILLPKYDFSFVIPNRSLTKKYRKKYFYVFHNRVALIKTSFGCPFKCNFCFCRKITDDLYFERPLKNVITELKSIKEKEIYIVDDDFLVSPKRVKRFIQYLHDEKINKRFLIYGRADFVVSHPDIIKDFKKVGLRTVIVGLESFNNEELLSFNKMTSNALNQQALKVLNNNKVNCFAAVIVSPDWAEEDFENAKKVMAGLGIKFLNLQPLTPLKGTGINFNSNRLIVKRNDFARWDLAHVIIRPENLSIMDFYKNILQVYQAIILKPLHLLGYIRYNPLMQLKMIKGLFKVRRQYLIRIMESRKYA